MDATPRVPRIARLVALAIRFDQLIRDGAVKDQAELARLGHVTRARVTQIMNLLNLASDIQEEILGMNSRGRLSLSERDVRAIVAESRWTTQRQMWGNLRQWLENSGRPPSIRRSSIQAEC